MAGNLNRLSYHTVCACTDNILARPGGKAGCVHAAHQGQAPQMDSVQDGDAVRAFVLSANMVTVHWLYRLPATK